MISGINYFTAALTWQLQNLKLSTGGSVKIVFQSRPVLQTVLFNADLEKIHTTLSLVFPA